MKTLPLALILGSFLVFPCDAQERPKVERGLKTITDEAYQGYTLYTPIRSKKTYLIDMQGRVVHQWVSEYTPGQSVYLLEDGSILRTGSVQTDEGPRFGGMGGLIQRISWEGEVLWEWRHSDETVRLHHDIEPLPNGNILAIAWELKSAGETEEMGRDPKLIDSGKFWPDKIIEIAPKGKDDADIVWEWHVWDHLIQDYDPELSNYGDVAEHPERVDINGERDRQEMTEEQRSRLEALGYFGGGQNGNRGRGRSDWNHTNAIDYNEDLDQIALSVKTFNEVWIIDHSTTTEEAASSSGGRWGRGGDLLYRWGNPQTYRQGTPLDQRFFGQHDIQWIEEGCPGEGNLLIFNNGQRRLGKVEYSSVEEWEPSMNDEGRYIVEAGRFGPAQTDWSYIADNPEDFYSSFISGAQRLPNGNTLICQGANGRFFEVTLDGDIVWEFLNNMKSDPQVGGEGGPRRGVGGRGDRGGRPGRGGRGRGGRGGRGRDMGFAVFRVTRYGLDYPAFQGKSLEPLAH